MKIKISTEKITFIVSIIGIFLLLLLANILPLEQLDIVEINNIYLNKKVVITGEIFNINDYDNFQVVSIKDDTGKIDITISNNLNLSKGDTIKVYGRVTEYKEFLQISADKIIKI